MEIDAGLEEEGAGEERFAAGVGDGERASALGGEGIDRFLDGGGVEGFAVGFSAEVDDAGGVGCGCGLRTAEAVAILIAIEASMGRKILRRCGRWMEIIGLFLARVCVRTLEREMGLGVGEASL